MPDTIVNFPLRDAASGEIGVALARCYQEFSLWHGQATFIAGFAEDARAAGVQAIIANRVRAAFDFAQSEGIIVAPGSVSDGLINQLVDQQVVAAHHGGRIAAIVMLHKACDQFLWRLVRFGLIANRSMALNLISDRKISVKRLEEVGHELAVDEHFEKWWNELERDTITRKWDSLVRLFGYPSKLHDGRWNFDREALSRFDDARHNAVHRDGGALKEFELTEFAEQLSRGNLAWLVHIGLLMHLRFPAQSLFLAPPSKV